MKAFAYTITISEGTMAFIHGAFFDINEIYIPKYHIWINSEGIFQDPKTTRLKQAKNKQVIEIPNHLVQACVTAIHTKNKALQFHQKQFNQELTHGDKHGKR